MTDEQEAVIAAVHHQLAYGEASQGNPQDIDWCAEQLRVLLGAPEPFDRQLSTSSTRSNSSLNNQNRRSSVWDFSTKQPKPNQDRSFDCGNPSGQPVQTL